MSQLSPPSPDPKMGNEFITAPFGLTTTRGEEDASSEWNKAIGAQKHLDRLQKISKYNAFRLYGTRSCPPKITHIGGKTLTSMPDGPENICYAQNWPPQSQK